MSQNEDIPYTVSDYAIADDKKQEDIDAPNQPLLKEVQEYLRDAITEHNTFDIIDLTEQAKMTPTQQIAVHKQVVAHLRNISLIIDNKVKGIE